ncbi:hypothetical protein DIPPA_26863 [Diplonema papillatum]|nr:hypothetical protein DIPPA_26863 [Diplonema papillatum]
MKKGKKMGRGVKALKQILSSHKKNEEEYEAILATLKSHVSNYVNLERTPAITEDRLHFLEAKVSGLKTLLTAEQVSRGLSPYRSDKVSGQLAANLVYKINHLMMTVHAGNSLRIYSEIAHNIGCNIADVVVVERLLVRKWYVQQHDYSAPGESDVADEKEKAKKRAAPKSDRAREKEEAQAIVEEAAYLRRLPFPPLVLLVVFILTTPLSTISFVFHAQIQTLATHGNPPTFGRHLLAAASQQSWTVLVNWVGCMSILLALPVWFPLLTHPCKISLPLSLSHDRFTLGFAAATAVYYDVELENEENELKRAAELNRALKKAGARQKPEKPPAEKQPGKVVGTGSASVKARFQTAGGGPAAADVRGESEAWNVTLTETLAAKCSVFDVSALVAVPPSKGTWHRDPCIPRVGGATRAAAIAACQKQDAACLFAPFGVFSKVDPGPAAPAAGRSALLKKNGPSDADDAERQLVWQGSVYSVSMWEGLKITDEESESESGEDEGDDSRSEASSAVSRKKKSRLTTATSVSSINSLQSFEIPKRDKMKVLKELSEDDHRIFESLLKTVINYSDTAEDAADRLYRKLQKKLREPFVCTRHVYQQLKYFCPEDRAVLCEQCTQEHYAARYVISLSNQCTTEAARLSKKDEELKVLIQAASSLARQIPLDKNDLHRHVDEEIDSLIAALNARKQNLHHDIDQRRRLLSEAIETETVVCVTEKNTLAAACLVLECIARGDPAMVSPENPLAPILRQEATYDEFWEAANIRLHQPMGINSALWLHLPVEELVKSAERLDWSVPTQYLSSRVYPPLTSTCQMLPSKSRGTVSTVVTQKNRLAGIGAGLSAVAAARKKRAAAASALLQERVVAGRVLADSMENVWGLVISTDWRKSLQRLFRKHAYYRKDPDPAVSTMPALTRGVSMAGAARHQRFFDEFRQLFDRALALHVADGRYHPPTTEPLTSLAVADGLSVLPKSEKARLVTLDTVHATRSLPEFVAFISDYSELYAPPPPEGGGS